MNEKTIKIGLGGITGLISYICGSINYLWVILALMCIIDFVAGILASYYTNEKFCKDKAVRGAVVKLFYFVTILVGLMCDYIAIDLGIPFADGKVISLVLNFYFIGAEGFSFTKNLSKIGVPLPSILEKFFGTLKDGNV
jgi:toxin secretion/phage lysis holin